MQSQISSLASNLELSLTKQVSTMLVPCFSFHPMTDTLILNISCLTFQNTHFFYFYKHNINPLSAILAKWSNKLKQFVSNNRQIA